MGRVVVWLVEVGSGLYALTGSLVVLGGFVMFLIEMAKHVSAKRPGHRKINVYVNEVHIHVHTTAGDDPLRSLPRHLELPRPDDRRTGPDKGS